MHNGTGCTDARLIHSNCDQPPHFFRFPCPLECPPSCRCRALLSTGAGPLLAAGSDRCIRLWDSLRPEASYVVCGPPQARGCSSASAGSGDHAPAYRARSVGAVRVVEETCPLPLPPHSAETPDQQQQQRSMPAGGGGGAVGICHQDAVTQLAYVDTADRLLLSCSRDGVIKAWR